MYTHDDFKYEPNIKHQVLSKTHTRNKSGNARAKLIEG